MKILVVDDNRAIGGALRRLLELQGYPVAAAGRGSEALKKARLAKPDLVLVDFRMPGMNGAETARRLRQNGFEGPIIGMAATREPAEHLFLEAGADTFLLKGDGNFLIALGQIIRRHCARRKG